MLKYILAFITKIDLYIITFNFKHIKYILLLGQKTISSYHKEEE